MTKLYSLLLMDCQSFFFFLVFNCFYFYLFFFSFIHMCIQCLGHFFPLPPSPSRYQAETILPLSLILLKREYKQ
jgi:hypothetical protein